MKKPTNSKFDLELPIALFLGGIALLLVQASLVRWLGSVVVMVSVFMAARRYTRNPWLLGLLVIALLAAWVYIGILVFQHTFTGQGII
jgi:hypothetical protein